VFKIHIRTWLACNCCSLEPFGFEFEGTGLLVLEGNTVPHPFTRSHDLIPGIRPLSKVIPDGENSVTIL
jgi:hypothetical protein